MIRLILDAGGDPVVLDDLSTGVKTRVPHEVALVEESLFAEQVVLDRLKEQKFDVVLHFASLKNSRESMVKPVEYWQSIVEGTAAAMRLAQSLGASTFVYASSCAVFGDQEMVTESSAPKPVSPYGEAKLEAESMIRSSVQAGKFRASILRYFNVIGNDYFPDARDVSAGHLVPDVVARVVKGHPITVARSSDPTPDGSCVRDFIDVRDIATAHLLAANRLLDGPGEAACEHFNLSTGQPVSTLTLVETLVDALGVNAEVGLSVASPADPSRIFGSPAAKAQSLLGWRPTLSLRDSVKSIAMSVGHETQMF